MQVESSDGRIRFRGLEVDLRSGELHREGVRVPIQHQPFRVLVRLLNQPGEVVTREALRRELWSVDTFVDFDQGLNAAVKRLREALGDSAEAPQFIETLPKRGYRFITPTASSSDFSTAGTISAPSAQSGGAFSQRARTPRFTRLAVTLVLLGSAAAMTFTGSRGGRQAARARGAEPTLVRLTSNPAAASVTSSIISPDGRYIAFGDPNGLQLRSIASGEVYPLPDTAGMNVYGWTPDSRGVLASRCAAPSCSGWEISVIGHDRHLTGAVWPMDDSVKVAPDGVRLLRHGYSDSALLMNPMDGTPEVRLASGRIYAANWSADGGRVLFVRDLSIIESVPAIGGTSREVFRATGDQRINDVIELPDRSILIAMNPSSSTPGASTEVELWKLSMTQTGVPIGLPHRLTWGFGTAALLSASSNGERVAFQRVVFQSDVYIANCDLRNGRVGQPRRFTWDDSDDRATGWTPDSRAVLFESDRNGTTDIFKQPIEGNVAESFLRGPGEQTDALVTGDHRWVLYSEGPKSARNIKRVPLDGGAPELVLAGGEGFFLCAVNGRCVVGKTRDGTMALSSLDPVLGIGAELARIPENFAGIDLLPNGDGFAYIPRAGRDVRNRVQLVSFTGKPPTEIIVHNATRLFNLSWLPSDSGFIASDGGALVLVSRSGVSRVVWSAPSLTAAFAVPSPNERHLAITVGSRHSNVWMIKDF